MVPAQQHRQAIEQPLVVDSPLQIFAQEFHPILDVGARGVAAGRHPNRKGGQRRTVIPRFGGLPRLVVEIQPRPGAFQIAGCELQRPHVGKRLPRIVTESACGRIAGGEHQRVQTASVPRDSLLLGRPRVWSG